MAQASDVKAVIFDIGGVVTLSPLQAVIDFERKNSIPSGWINFAIRHSSPNGFWQRLERGEITPDQGFFEGFGDDLNSREVWQKFKARSNSGNLKDRANPTQLADHTSTKAEHTGSTDTESSDSRNNKDAKSSLSKLAKDTTIGDPVSLESEDVVESEQNDNKAQQTPKDRSRAQPSSHSDRSPGPSAIDGQSLFWSMMLASRELDPYVYPAVSRLVKQKDRPLVIALSNDVRFPPDHEWNKPESKIPGNHRSAADLKSLFDDYITSSNEGMRKPSKEIYELALQRLNRVAKGKGDDNRIQGHEVVFLDDIGENLKAAKDMGMQTIKVQLGKTFRAVKELEMILKMDLMDAKTRKAKL